MAKRDEFVESTTASWEPAFPMKHNWNTVEIVYNEHEDQAEFAHYNRFSL